VLLCEVVATSAAVAQSPGRRAKVAEIASLLARVPPDEVPVAVAFLSGDLTQRQIGVGYAALTDLPENAQPRPRSEPVLTLAETDATFEAIGALLGAGSQAQRRAMLAGLVARATEAERQFLVRLLAGDLRQGALEGVMIEAVAQAAGVLAAEVRRAHQLRGSLPQVARAALIAAADSAGREAVTSALRAFTLQVGQPIRPMLAASAPSIDAALSRISPAAFEWKIDGIRIQIHRNGQQVRVFTRTLDDITERVPELVAIARSLDAQSAVLDGEAVALRPDGRPYPFQVTSARVASQSVPGSPSTVPLTAFLFDLLHVDGQDLIDHPAGDRYERLAAIVPADLRTPRLITADPQEAAAFFATAIERGHEGVVVKSVLAPYGAGRRGSDWIKVKPRTTLDLVILAAEWGHGRRAGLLSNLHLGARDPGTGGFVMLGKTFKGLTDAMLGWQTEQLLALARSPAAAADEAGAAAGAGGPDGPDGPGTPGGPIAPGGPIEPIEPGGPGSAAAPGGPTDRAWRHGVVRVRPELVAEIAFDGVQASKRYPGGVTLRFARVLRYRTDKRAEEADTIDMVRALWPHDQEA
jgi:DNA ligase-1